MNSLIFLLGMVLGVVGVIGGVVWIFALLIASGDR